MALTSRLARREDLPALLPLVEAAIGGLQKGFLDDAQIRSSRAIIGIDTRLIDDGTYCVIELDGQAVGCGGWMSMWSLNRDSACGPPLHAVLTVVQTSCSGIDQGINVSPTCSRSMTFAPLPSPYSLQPTSADLRIRPPTSSTSLHTAHSRYGTPWVRTRGNEDRLAPPGLPRPGSGQRASPPTHR